MIIPRKDALRARIEELGGIWEKGETVESLEKRVGKLSVGLQPSFYIPDEAKESDCYGVFWDENVDPCIYRYDCKFSRECYEFTRAKIEQKMLDCGKPHKREFI